MCCGSRMKFINQLLFLFIASIYIFKTKIKIKTKKFIYLIQLKKMNGGMCARITNSLSFNTHTSCHHVN